MEKYSKNTSSSQLKSVVFFTNNGHDPCTYLRLRGPMRQLGIGVIDGKLNERVYPKRISRGDIVLIQRDFPRNLKAYDKVIELAHQENKAIVYDIDDLLLHLPETHPERTSHHYTESLLPILQALHEADLVTVTTPKLRQALIRYNDQTILLPNFFDDFLWQLREPVVKPKNDAPLIIGYMGSESHMPDIEYIAPVLGNLVERFQEKLQLHFWGVKPPKQLAGLVQVKWIPAQTYEYNDFAAYFQSQYADIFIAPLLDNDFNRAKSPLKFFEYSALGAPGVYSRLDAFEQVIRHGQEGLLASSLEEWHENLVLLIENSDLRYQLTQKAQETICENWLLSENVGRWQATYMQIIESHSEKDVTDLEALSLVKSLNHQYYDLNRRKDKIQKERDSSLVKKDRELNNLKSDLSATASDLRNSIYTLIAKDREISVKESTNQALTFELAEIKVSKAWKIALFIRKARLVLVPQNSTRAKVTSFFLHWMQGQKIRITRKRQKARLNILLDTDRVQVKCKEIEAHQEPIDVIICVHNALEDVRKCLESVKLHTNPPFSVIIVDDGSDTSTRDFLSDFAASEPWCTLIRNEEAKGYTLAGNIGMRASKALYLVLLNSDTIVGPEWLDRLYRAMCQDEKTAVVGPLSNTASWQSIPKLSKNGDWAINALPEGVTVAGMSQLIAKYAACILPEVPLLNGFCMMIRKQTIEEIGYFDEDSFGQGYGEEDDFNLRAGKAGWKKVIADDVFIYHAQSKSYSNEKRYVLSRYSGEKLRKKHGVNLIAESVEFMNPNRVMEGIRSRSEVMLEREAYLEKGQAEFAGKRVLFILPVIDAGGGANVIIDEARYMRQMGVDVSIFNLMQYKAGFMQSYPHIDIPLIFKDEKDLEKVAVNFDAVAASAHYSVEWLKPLETISNRPRLGYYIQGFEALMYPVGSEQAEHAIATYTMIDGIRRFTKTQWTRKQVLDHTNADSDVIGISVNIALFQPRDMISLGVKPVTIVAMIRPSSPYRNPEMTISILRQVVRKYGKEVDICLFGANDVREVVDEKHLDFKWRQLGKLTQVQVASMMSKADIFADFSSHQAMGLSALEALSAGCSVIVPQNGGAVEFIHHKENGIVVNTSNFDESLHALEELVEDDKMRKALQIAGLKDVVQYYPEKVSYNILCSLFKS